MCNNPRQNKFASRIKCLRQGLRTGSLSLVAALMIGVLVSPVAAQDSDNLQKLESTIAKEKRAQEILVMQSHALQQEARNIRRQLINSAARTQEQEGLIENLSSRLIELREEATYRRNRLSERSSQLSTTLGALTKLSDESASAFFLFPGTPKQSVQSAMLLKSAVPALRDRADVLREELNALNVAESDIEFQLQELENANTRLQIEKEDLAVLLKRKDKLARRTAADKKAAEKNLAKLVREARSLKDLLNKLNKVRPAQRPEAPKPEPQAPSTPEATVKAAPAAAAAIVLAKPASVRDFPKKGGLPFPAKGKIVQRYGQDLGFGQSAKGIKIRTRAGAQLVVPHDGQIAFSGPFRDHGLIIIIEHQGGYHTILSGLTDTNVVTGQWVLAGEPVGAMGPKGTASKNLELYVELRRAGKPLNPLSWFKRG